MSSTPTTDALEPLYETGLGILRAREMRELRRGRDLIAITPEIRKALDEPKLLIVTKSAVRARVHRRVYMDYVGVKQLRPRRQARRRVPHHRVVHVERLHALDPLDPVSAPQDRCE